MPQTFGKSLKSHLRDKQSAVAQRWLELWQQRHGAAEWKFDTINAHLSRTLNDRELVFFADPERMTVLFDAASVPEGVRSGLRALAELGRAPRLVVDITRWPDKGDAVDALFDQLRDAVFADQELLPAHLVLTERQHGRMPHNFVGLVEAHAVRSAEDGPARSRELAGGTALVLSPWQFEPFERWLAGHFTGERLVLEPEDGLVVFAEHGGLPSIPEVVHSLADLTKPSNERFSVDGLSPVDRRRLMYMLADEATLPTLLAEAPNLRRPAARLAFARQLEAAAASLASERRAREVDDLVTSFTAATSMKVETLDEKTHQRLLARAERQPVGPTAWRCSDEIHLIGVEPPQEHTAFVLHTPEPPVPALSRLLEHLKGWTEDDHASDPTLLRAIAAIAPEDQRRPLLHARATILWNDLLPVVQPASRVDDWEEALRGLFAGDPPATSLYLREDPSWAENESEQQSFFAVKDAALSTIESGIPPELRGTPGRKELVLSRGQSAQWIAERIELVPTDVREDRDDDEVEWVLVNHHGRHSARWGYIPRITGADLQTGEHLDRWLDSLEGSLWGGGWAWTGKEGHQEVLRGLVGRRFTFVEHRLTARKDIRVESEAWNDADHSLAQTWLLMRAALRDPLAVRLHTGTIMLSLGGGISALIDVHERRGALHGERPGELTAALATELVEKRNGLEATPAHVSLSTQEAQVGPYTSKVDVRVPQQVSVRGPHARADIRFVVSPLLTSVQSVPFRTNHAVVMMDED